MMPRAVKNNKVILEHDKCTVSEEYEVIQLLYAEDDLEEGEVLSEMGARVGMHGVWGD